MAHGDTTTISKAPTKNVELLRVRVDGGTQSRAALSETTVADYAEAMTNGVVMPAIVVFEDGSDIWLADGFHRVMASRRLDRTSIEAEIRIGTRRDALLFAIGANSAHGLQRSSADKRHAVMLMLKDSEWSRWADREIAEKCGVGRTMVGDWRRTLKSILPETDSMKSTRSFVHPKTGQTATMRTENIGKRRGMRPGYLPIEDRAAQIEELAKDGHRSDQIAEQLSIGAEHVRVVAKAKGITLPDAQIGKVSRINHHRIVETTVMSLEAQADSLKTTGYSVETIEPSQAADWITSLNASMRAFAALRTQLQRRANGQA